jgi:arylsulfatase A-like enzyme
VPMLVRYPASFSQGAVCGALVEPVDIAPTLLDAAGAEVPRTMQGKSLRGA